MYEAFHNFQFSPYYAKLPSKWMLYYINFLISEQADKYQLMGSIKLLCISAGLLFKGLVINYVMAYSELYEN